MPPVPTSERPALIRAHVGLRGVAALLVVAYHLQFGTDYRLPIEMATALPMRGYLAVDLFFILSGFIISYVNRADRPTPMTRDEVRRFRQARIARLYPLLAFSLIAMVLLAAAKTGVYLAAGKLDPTDWSPRSLVILASQALLLNAWIPGAIGWNIPSWSISAEVTAYLLFPLLVAWHIRAPRLFKALALTASIGFYLTVAATTRSLDLISGLAPVRCVAGFLLGMLIFHARALPARMSATALGTAQIACTAAVLLLVALPIDDPLIVPFYVALVAATWPDRGIIARLLSTRPLHWLGDISYSVYLTHIAVIDALGQLWPRLARVIGLAPPIERAIWLALAFAGVLAWSSLTFRYVERPARQWLMRRFTGHRAPPITTTPPGP